MSRWRYHLPILAYHRVGALRGDHVPTVSAETFERHLRFLARRKFRVLALDEVADCLERGGPLPRHSVVVTFDDGYEETHAVAWPLLKQYGFPAIVFVTPAEVGLAGFATWDQVTAMAKDGMAIGSHTVNHAYLPLLHGEQLEGEIVESKRLLEAKLGRAVTSLSYPVGGFSSEIQELVRHAGYRAACTTNRAWAHGTVDRYALRRIKITERDRNLLIFWAKVSGYYDAFRRLEQPA